MEDNKKILSDLKKFRNLLFGVVDQRRREAESLKLYQAIQFICNEKGEKSIDDKRCLWLELRHSFWNGDNLNNLVLKWGGTNGVAHVILNNGSDAEQDERLVFKSQGCNTTLAFVPGKWTSEVQNLHNEYKYQKARQELLNEIQIVKNDISQMGKDWAINYLEVYNQFKDKQEKEWEDIEQRIAQLKDKDFSIRYLLEEKTGGHIRGNRIA